MAVQAVAERTVGKSGAEDKESYAGWLKGKIESRPEERSHGFHHRGQYEGEKVEQTD